MSTVDVVNGAVAIAAAVFLAAIGMRLLRWVIAVMPLDPHRRTAVRRWLPVMQLVLGVLVFSAVAMTAFGALAAAIVAAAAAVLVLIAAWFAIRDVIAGIVLRADHGFEEDRVVTMDDVAGTIQRVGVRSIEIETPDGRRVRIPYGRLSRSSVMVGGTREGTGALRFTVTLPRGETATDDIAAIRSAALHSFFASASREPRIRLATEDEATRSYEVTVYADDPAYLPAIEDAVLDELNARSQ